LAANSFDERASARMEQLSPIEREVTRFFQANREEVLVASASSLAAKIGTSDATVVRTVQTLGYSGLGELRRQLADEIRSDLSPASRLERTLGTVGDALEQALQSTLAIHLQAIEDLRRNVSPALFARAVGKIRDARRVVIFGIGPSAAIADYFAVQLRRFGFDCITVTNTGLLIADDLIRIRRGDLVIILAYSRVYLELRALFDRIDDTHAKAILLTDTLGAALRNRVEMVLPVARGRVDSFSMHTATMAMVEALLVGIATAGPKDVIDSLRELNRLRAMVAGDNVELGRVRARKRGRVASGRKGVTRNSGNKARGRRIRSKGA
jgi:DNA-binding MurR/RpiR family transcriptional regulator